MPAKRREAGCLSTSGRPYRIDTSVPRHHARAARPAGDVKS